MGVAWHLKGKPKEVQVVAQDTALDRTNGRKSRGFAYFMEQGLGKTSTALNEFVDMYGEGVEHMVVTCPQTFKIGWKAEAEKWGVPFEDVHVWPWKKIKISKNGPSLFVVNYEAARSSGGALIQENIMEKWPCYFAVDESSALANPSSAQTKSVMALARTSEHVRLLNGTPMAENVVDLYGQLRTIRQLNGQLATVFKRRFAKMGGFKGRQIVGINEDAEDELHQILDACSFRALKKDWWDDYQEKEYVPLRYEMSDVQLRAYREMYEDFYLMLDSGVDVTASMVITQIAKLQQITSGFVMVDGEPHQIVEPKKNPKVRLLQDIIDGDPSKIIVPVHHTEALTMLEEALRDFNPAVIMGKTKRPDLDVDEEKAKFNGDNSCKVLLGQIDASHMGHTLLGTESMPCHRMFFFENTFSRRKRSQMEDRNHREGQKNQCWYYDPCSSPTEQKFIDALIRKQDLVTAVIDVVRATRGKIDA